MRLVLFMAMLPVWTFAQDGLTIVESVIIGDPTRSTDQRIEFGFNAVIAIASLDEGCTITINPGAPVITSFGSFSAGIYACSVEGLSDNGEYNPLSSTMTIELPIYLWTRVFSAQCKCPPGKFIGITEMKRP